MCCASAQCRFSDGTYVCKFALWSETGEVDRVADLSSKSRDDESGMNNNETLESNCIDKTCIQCACRRLYHIRILYLHMHSVLLISIKYTVFNTSDNSILIGIISKL
jgi:hypothetical protein